MRFHSLPLFLDLKNQECGNVFSFKRKTGVSKIGIDVKNWRQEFQKFEFYKSSFSLACERFSWLSS